MKNNEKKNKHMTLDDQIEIQERLKSKGMTFKAIGERIGKSQTTISKEVKIHMESYTNSFVRTDEVCPKLLKAPFVCNGCEKKSRSNCPYRRQVYTAKKAQAEYDTVLVESRTGIPLNKESFYENGAYHLRSCTERTAHLPYHSVQQFAHINRYGVPPYSKEVLFYYADGSSQSR